MRTNDASGAYYHDPDDDLNNPHREAFFNHNWDQPIIQVPPQEIKFHKIPMDPGTRAALIFFLATLFCVTGLIAYLIYSVT